MYSPDYFFSEINFKRACKPSSVVYCHLSTNNVSVIPQRYFNDSFRRNSQRNEPSILRRVGFTQPPALPRGRWAFTPPFHPYRNIRRLFSVALSLKSPSPGFLRHPVPETLGLSSLTVFLRPRVRTVRLKSKYIIIPESGFVNT